MKTALIFFRDFNKIFKAEYYSAVASSFENAGVDIHGLEVLSETDDLCFKRRLSEYKDTVDNLIVFQSENLTFDIKSIIAEVTETVMVENDTA